MAEAANKVLPRSTGVLMVVAEMGDQNVVKPKTPNCAPDELCYDVGTEQFGR